MVFQAGDFVGVRCEVRPGPFDNEKVVTVETVNGPISGFVTSNDLREIDGQWEVLGQVQDLSGEVLKVMIYGSFFTTNGIASIQKNLAIAA